MASEKEPKKESKEKTSTDKRVKETCEPGDLSSMVGIGVLEKLAACSGLWSLSLMCGGLMLFAPKEPFPKGPYAKFMDRLLGATAGEEKPKGKGEKKPDDGGAGKKPEKK